MNVSSARFDLTSTEKARIGTFKNEIWYNSEVCSHCFSRVREVEANPRAARLSKTSLKNHPASFHERTDLGTQEHHEWDYNTRFGTCFCLECGGDLSASHYQLSRGKMKAFAKNLARYIDAHTSLSLDHRRFFAELLRLKDSANTQGRESQIFAVAFARALQTRTESSSTPTTQPAD